MSDVHPWSPLGDTLGFASVMRLRREGTADPTRHLLRRNMPGGDPRRLQQHDVIIP